MGVYIVAVVIEVVYEGLEAVVGGVVDECLLIDLHQLVDH